MNASEDALSELSERVKIDPDSMDVEIITQSNDFYHAATGVAMAISLRDQAKNDLDVAEAELYLMFRRQAVDKITEAQLDAMVKANEVRQEYFEKYLKAKQLADRWTALRDSFTQKGHALRELAELYKLNYFGERTTNSVVADAEPTSETALHSMTIAEYVLAGLLIFILAIIVSYLLGWSFSAGYHNHKYQHTKRLVALLREGTSSQ